MVKGFSKMFISSFFGIFLQTFYNIIGFCKKFNFCNFLQILKVEHKSFPMMYHLSYLDIKYGIWGGPLTHNSTTKKNRRCNNILLVDFQNFLKTKHFGDNLGPIGSAVLTFIRYNRTQKEKQTSKVFIYKYTARHWNEK